MTEPLHREIDALAARANASMGQRFRALFRAKVYRARVQAYRACFLDDDGNVSAAGKIVLADLARLAGLGVARPARSSDEIQFDEGQRRIALHVIDHLHLDEDRLARWARQIRENEE